MAAGVWSAGRWYPDGWEWDSPAQGRDHGHRVRLVRTPVPRRDGSPSEKYLVIVRTRPEDPDPDAVRAALRILAEQEIVRTSRNTAGQEVFILAGPSLTADATVLHSTLDLLPGWPITPAEPESPEPPAEPPSPRRRRYGPRGW